MKKYPLYVFILLIAFILLVDFYAFEGVKIIASYLNEPFPLLLYITYWLFTASIIVAIIVLTILYESDYKPKREKAISRLISLVILSFFPKAIFVLFSGFAAISKAIFSSEPERDNAALDIAILITNLGLLTAAGVFLFILHELIRGRKRFKIIRHEFSFPNLPQNFDGLKVVQFSDMHLGSFRKKKKMVRKGIRLINRLEPDVLVFTGDLVNNYAQELEGWEPVFQNLRAKLGMYSILGNHDYGDYSAWHSPEEKATNLQKIIDFEKRAGFDVLLNEWQELRIGDEAIAIAGVENWGKTFKQYGDLEQAIKGTENYPFTLLLSHDPTHWEEQVAGKTNIDLTLSGHTHGAQFAFGFGQRKWSPVRLKYKKWAGPYSLKKQMLYINRGFGFIGFHGRINMPPEITFITLRKET